MSTDRPMQRLIKAHAHTYLVCVEVQVLQHTCWQHLTQLGDAVVPDAVVAQVGHHTAGVERQRLDDIRSTLVAKVFGRQISMLAVL